MVYLLCLVTFLLCFIVIICALNAIWGRREEEGALTWFAVCADGLTQVRAMHEPIQTALARTKAESQSYIKF